MMQDGRPTGSILRRKNILQRSINPECVDREGFLILIVSFVRPFLVKKRQKKIIIIILEKACAHPALGAFPCSQRLFESDRTDPAVYNFPCLPNVTFDSLFFCSFFFLSLEIASFRGYFIFPRKKHTNRYERNPILLRSFNPSFFSISNPIIFFDFPNLK